MLSGPGAVFALVFWRAPTTSPVIRVRAGRVARLECGDGCIEQGAIVCLESAVEGIEVIRK